jgi:hypothetical protein
VQLTLQLSRISKIKNSLLIRSSFIIALGITSLQTHAVKPFVITCGDGNNIEVADSRHSPNKANNLCVRAGYPALNQADP